MANTSGPGVPNPKPGSHHHNPLCRSGRGTPKRKRLLKAMLQYPEATQAELAKRAGMHYQTARRAMHDPYMQRALQQMMEDHPELCRIQRLERLAEGLKSNRSIVINDEVVEVPDMATRRPYLELAFKLSGELTTPEDQPHGDKISLAILIVRERERRGLEPIPQHIIDAHPEAP